jgi:hypothetical protein
LLTLLQDLSSNGLELSASEFTPGRVAGVVSEFRIAAKDKTEN